MGLPMRTRMAGGNVKRWSYGEYNELTIKQPVAGGFPFFRGFFNVGPLPMSGSSDDGQADDAADWPVDAVHRGPRRIPRESVPTVLPAPRPPKEVGSRRRAPSPSC